MKENVFSRNNHKTASWVIDIEVIGLLQDKISFSRPFQVCNVILRDNYFMRFVGVPVHEDFQILNFFLLSLYYLCLYTYCLTY